MKYQSIDGTSSLDVQARGNSPSAFKFYFDRGRIFYYLGKYDRAISDFRLTLRLNWRHERAIVWLDKAERAERTALKKDPRDRYCRDLALLVIVPRHAKGLRDLLIIHGGLQDHPFGQLIDHAALDFLPGCLACRTGISAPGRELLAAAFISSGAIRMSALRLLRSMRTRSPVRNRASPPPAAASGDALRIDGVPDVPDCRPSPMHGSEIDALPDERSGGCMFTTSAEPDSRSVRAAHD